MGHSVDSNTMHIRSNLRVLLQYIQSSRIKRPRAAKSVRPNYQRHAAAITIAVITQIFATHSFQCSRAITQVEPLPVLLTTVNSVV